MPWRPSFPGERPTLGGIAVSWMIDNLAAPDREDYEPYYPTAEQYEFLLAFYELDPLTGRRVTRRAVWSRSRGAGKSPFVSAVGLFEGLGDCLFAGWDANGRPIGKPWRKVRKPVVALAAATEEQTKNAWLPMLDMVREDSPVHDNYDGIEPMATRINFAYGYAKPLFSSVTSTKGDRPVIVLLDQTEQWTPSNGGVDLAKTLINNATKVGGSVIETPNAYTRGMHSVAEASAKAYHDQAEGRTKRDVGLLYDHREAPPDTDLTDHASLEAGLRYAYGCASGHPDGCVLHEPPCPPGWVDIETIISRVWDTDAEEADSRADWLNQITHAADAWLDEIDWTACRDRDKVVEPNDAIVLGFDGSRGRAKGKPDATALIGCRVSDGHLFEVKIWEADERDEESWESWEPPIPEIEETLDRIILGKPQVGQRPAHFVVGFFADPARDWRSHVDGWESRYIRQLRANAARSGARAPVVASQKHPFEWWMTGGRSTVAEQAIEQLESAIKHGDVSHAGHDALTRHMIHARRRLSHGKLALGKSSSYSRNKIDGAVAAVLAWQCRLDAVAAGLGVVRRPTAVPSRIR